MAIADNPSITPDLSNQASADFVSLQQGLAPKSIMLQGVDVSHVPVQKTSLSRLKYELKAICFHRSAFDWVSLFAGCAAAETINCFIELFMSSNSLIIHLSITVVLWIITFVIYVAKKNSENSERNAVYHEHALLALKEIYIAAGLSFEDDNA